MKRYAFKYAAEFTRRGAIHRPITHVYLQSKGDANEDPDTWIVKKENVVNPNIKHIFEGGSPFTRESL